jgi:hypothetical protein
MISMVRASSADRRRQEMVSRKCTRNNSPRLDLAAGVCSALRPGSDKFTLPPMDSTPMPASS